MKFRIFKYTLMLLGGVTFGSNIGYGQTLFKLPDTLPNYGAYQHVDECFVAVRRNIRRIENKDTIWYDTALYDPSRIKKTVPDGTVSLGRLCLSRINVDAVPISEYNTVLPVLLLVNRDEDVDRLVHKTLDTVRSSKKDSIFNAVARMYNNAMPKRLQLLEKLFAREDSPYKKDPSDGSDLIAEVMLANTAFELGNPERAMALVREIMKKDGKYSAKLRGRASQSAIKYTVYPLVIEILQDEAMDSLAKSTTAYRRFLEGVWGHLSDLPFAELGDISGSILPELSGNFYHSNVADEKNGSDKNNDNHVRNISAYSVPIKEKINLIVFLRSGCHSQSTRSRAGRNSGIMGVDCWRKAALVKRLKIQFPEIEVSVVSKTFGSIGIAPPLNPKDEADTLASYFLGFYKIPGKMITAETEFIRMPGYDRRRVDISADYESSLVIDNLQLEVDRLLILTDEAGRIFHVSSAYPERLEPLLVRKLNAVTRRVRSSR